MSTAACLKSNKADLAQKNSIFLLVTAHTNISELDYSFKFQDSDMVFSIIQAGREVLGGTPIGSQGKFEVFEEISQKTGAFVKQPSYNDKVGDCIIYGRPSLKHALGSLRVG